VLEKLGAEMESVVTAANAIAPDAHFGLIPFQDKYVLDATGSLSEGKVHTEAKTLQAAFKNYLDNYTAFNRNPGDPWSLLPRNSICEENALDSLYAAAVEFPWRPNATRVVIAVTDDTFLERPDDYGKKAAGDILPFPDYDAKAKWTVAETVAQLQEKRARVFSFSRLKAGDFGGCSTGRRLGQDDVSDGWSTPYGTHDPIPVTTGGKNFDLKQVKDGMLSLSATINEVVVDSYCNPIFE
jgi:hypothetical protein